MSLSNEQINAMFKDIPMHKKIIVDVKGIKDRKEMLELGYKYWRL